MLTTDRPAIPVVVQQHAAEAAHLRGVRSVLVRAPHVRRLHLGRHDARIVAHLDGLSVSGKRGRELVMAELAAPGVGELFAATSSALEAKDGAALEKLLAVAEAQPPSEAGLISAFGWASASTLRGITTTLLDSPNVYRRRIGLAACAVHRVDPGNWLVAGVNHADVALRARACRAVGEIGRHDLASACASSATDDAPDCRLWRAWSAVLLGDRNRSLASLADWATTDGPHRTRAFALAIQAMSPRAAGSWLKAMASDGSDRLLIQGSALIGDPATVPWLLERLRNDQTARAAGEAFTVITGADLARLDLDRPQPEGFESGPNDNPDDENVEMDPDESLPWPDAEKVEKWWAANAHRFQPGIRYFMGAPVTRQHCIDVLRNGYQRQRILAAHYLCLLDPGTPLFNTSAPAWRQERLLARM